MTRKPTKKRADPMPRSVNPMLAEGVTQLPMDDDHIEWLYQPKIDGHRTILYKVGDRVRIRTRYDKTPIVDMANIEAQAADLDADTAILDGEVAAVDKKGIPNWEALQRRDPAFALRFFPFDALYHNGVSLLSMQLLPTPGACLSNRWPH